MKCIYCNLLYITSACISLPSTLTSQQLPTAATTECISQLISLIPNRQEPHLIPPVQLVDLDPPSPFQIRLDIHDSLAELKKKKKKKSYLYSTVEA